MLYIYDLDYFNKGPAHHLQVLEQQAKDKQERERFKLRNLFGKRDEELNLNEKEKYDQLKLESLRNLLHKHNRNIMKVPAICQNLQTMI